MDRSSSISPTDPSSKYGDNMRSTRGLPLVPITSDLNAALRFDVLSPKSHGVLTGRFLCRCIPFNQSSTTPAPTLGIPPKNSRNEAQEDRLSPASQVQSSKFRCQPPHVRFAEPKPTMKSTSPRMPGLSYSATM